MKCRAPGDLTAGGRIVATVRCELEKGHDVEQTIEVRRPDGSVIHDRRRPSPHRYLLEWNGPGETSMEAASEPDTDVPFTG